MSLYRDYFLEARKGELIETEDAFVSYLIEKQTCYIEDIYVRPMARRKHEAFRLGEQMKVIAKEKGCTELMTTVNLNILDPSTSLRGILKFGFKVVSANNQIILLKMEL